jgi:uncharacterized coiled-coil DUF342 family protein
MEITVSWIFDLIITGVCGFAVWSLKEHYKQVKEDMSEFKGRVERISDKLPKDYVLKEDFHREINKFDQKLDFTRDEVSEINKKLASVIALLGGGVNK